MVRFRVRFIDKDSVKNGVLGLGIRLLGLRLGLWLVLGVLLLLGVLLGRVRSRAGLVLRLGLILRLGRELFGLGLGQG